MGSGIKYTSEFKAAAVAEVLDTSRPVKDVAAEIEVLECPTPNVS